MISFLKNKTVSFVNLHKQKFFNIFIYFLGLFLLKGASLILTPLYTNAFDTSNYGVIEYANTIYNLLSIIVGLGLSAYIGIEFFHVDDIKRKHIINVNVFMYILLSSGILLILLILYFLKIIKFNGIDFKMIVLILINSFTVYFYNLFYIFCKNMQKTNYMTLVQLLLGVLSLILNYVFIVLFKYGIYSSMLSTLVINSIYIILIIRLLEINSEVFKVKVDFEYIIKVLSISLPLLMGSIISWVLALSDRFFLAKFCTLSDVGLYSLSYKIANIFNMLVINSLTVFYAPHIYKRFQLDGIVSTEKYNRRYFYIYLLFSFIVVTAFYFLVQLIFPFFVNNRYAEAKRYIFPLLVSHIFVGATYFRTYLINYNKLTNYLFYINLVSAIVNIFTNFIFIPKYGIVAAVLTTLLSTIVSYIVAYILNINVLNKWIISNNI